MRFEVVASNSENEPCCSNNFSKDFLSLPARSTDGTRETTTSMYVFSRSPAITINPQPGISKVDIVDMKSNLNVGARDVIPKQRVFINQNEALPPLAPNVSAQSLPVGPVPLSDVGTTMVQSESIALETIKGLRTTICEGITPPKRKLPAFNDSIGKGLLKADKES